MHIVRPLHHDYDCADSPMPVLHPKSPPIHKLHHDLLLFIFTLNAEDDGPSLWPRKDRQFALFTTRDASHVCRSWRTVILSSPSLWAKLIDTNYLARTDPEWREELLRRTGDAPLDVEAIVDDTVDHEFLTSFFAMHWGRVEHLDLSGTHCNKSKAEEYFCTPAHALKSFRVRCIGAGSSPRALDGRRLFAGHAPHLRVLSLWGTTWVDVRAPWMVHLRHFEFSIDGSATLTLAVWLDALSVMSALESLILRRAFLVPEGPTAGGHYRDVHLPHLTDVEVVHSDFGVALLLAHLKLPPQSRVGFIATESTEPARASQTAFINGVIGAYARSWVPHHRPHTGIQFSVGSLQRPPGQRFSIEHFLYSPLHFVPRTENYLFKAACTTTNTPRTLPYFDTLTEPDLLSHITLLHIEIGNIPKGLDVPICRFMYALRNVETLYTDMNTLDKLTKMLSQTQAGAEANGNHATTPLAVFPKLHTLKLCSLETYVQSGCSLFINRRSDEVGHAFFAWRQRAGFAIAILDLTGCPKWQFSNMGYLEDLTPGLTVIGENGSGQRMEYVCGSGRRDILKDFSMDIVSGSAYEDVSDND